MLLKCKAQSSSFMTTPLRKIQTFPKTHSFIYQIFTECYHARGTVLGYVSKQHIGPTKSPLSKFIFFNKIFNLSKKYFILQFKKG